MAQPGVAHIEFHWPEKTGVLIYNSGQTTTDAVIKLVEEKTKRKLTIVADRALP